MIPLFPLDPLQNMKLTTKEVWLGLFLCAEPKKFKFWEGMTLKEEGQPTWQ